MTIPNKENLFSTEEKKMIHFVCFCTTQIIEASGLPFVVGTLSGDCSNISTHSCTILTGRNNEGYPTYSLIIDEKRLLAFVEKSHSLKGITYEISTIANNIMCGDFQEWYFQLTDLANRILSEKGQVEKIIKYMNFSSNILDFHG